jgi:hypothetical protein
MHRLIRRTRASGGHDHRSTAALSTTRAAPIR